MDYYHLTTNQCLDGQAVLLTSGINPEAACLENLNSAGFYPVRDEMREGLFDNPLPIYVVQGEYALKINSHEELPVDLVREKVKQMLNQWFQQEISRLLGNNGLSTESLLAFFLSESPFVNPLINQLKIKTNEIARLLSQVDQSETTEQIKLLYSEFQQSTILYGDS